MYRFALALALLSAPVTALAVPTTLPHQGRLLDSSGSPLDGAHDLTFSLYDAPAGGSKVWSESQSLTFDNGYFAATLGGTNPISASVLDSDDLWLTISVGSGAELPSRIKLDSVPFALRAGSIVGGSVDASEIRVNGTTIVNADGGIAFSHLVSLPSGLSDGDDDTLGDLSCGANHAAVYDGAKWACADLGTLPINGSQISSPVPVTQLPVGTGSTEVAAGDASYPKSDTYTKTEIDASLYGPGLGLEAGGGDLHISEYSYGPLIPNARFESGDFTGWNQDSGKGGVTSVTDGQAGSHVYRNDPFTVAWISSKARVDVRPMQNYKVTGSFRRIETVGNAGTFYLAVRLFDATGANIGGDGTWWYYPIAAGLTDTDWHTYAFNFGPAYGRAFPANAATMTVGAILNYDGGNRNYEVTNLQLTVADPPTSQPVMGAWHPAKHQTGCGASAYCALKMDASQYNTLPYAFTVSPDKYTVTVNVSGYYMINAHALVYQNGNQTTHFDVLRNGSRIQLSHHEYNTGTGWKRHDIHRPEYFAAGDKVTWRTYHSGAPHGSHLAHQGPDYTRLSLTLIR